MFDEIPKTNQHAYTYKCPYCKIVLKTKQNLIHHLTHSCPKKDSIEMHTKATIRLKPYEFLMKLPVDDHEIIFVTGPPKCGKSYWINEYVKAYKQMFGRKVFLFTRNEHDDTLANDEDKYIKITISDDLDADPLTLDDLRDSLIIMDDIESSEHKKGTQRAYNLLDDVCKNGRHYNINVIFANQECRMGVKTKKILSMLTMLVIYPSSGETYQCERLLKEYAGRSKSEINLIMNLQSRWVAFSRPKPQYVMGEHDIYMIGKEIY